MRSEIAQKILDSVAQTYNTIATKFSATRSFLWPELMYFKQFLANGQDVLDVGCGNGRILELLKDYQINYTGIDISEKLIAEAKNKWPDKNFMVGDVLDSVLLHDQKYDSILLISVLQHIPSHELQIKALNNLKNRLKDNGKILIINWNLYQKKYFKYIINFTFWKLFQPNKVINGIKVGDLDWGDVILTFKDNDQATAYRYLHAWRLHELSRIFNRLGFKVEKNFKTKFNLVSVISK